MSIAVEFNTIPEMFAGVTEKYAEIPRPLLMQKLSGKWVSHTFSEVREYVELTFGGLLSIGVQENDRVALISENRPEWVMCDQAIAAIGAVSVPLYPTFTSKQIEEIFLDADVSYAIVSNVAQLKKLLPFFGKINSLRAIVIFTDKELPPEENIYSIMNLLTKGDEFLNEHPNHFKECVKKITPENLLTIIYTSGTTGIPKGAMLTHRNIVSNIKACVAVLPIGADDVFLSFLPLCHAFERMAGYYTAMSCGATIAYAESIDTVRDNLMEIHPTILTAVPRFFERIHNRIFKQVLEYKPSKQKLFYRSLRIGKEYVHALRSKTLSPILNIKYKIMRKLVFQKLQDRTGGRMKFFVSGGGPLAKEMGEFFESIGLLVIEGYGLTESSPVLCVNRVDDYKFGTVGKPVPGVEVSLAEDGEILSRGENIMLGYWNDPITTQRTVDEEGWLHTGDIGEFDTDGFLKITDRKKHIIVTSGGKKIAPQQVENLLLTSELIEQIVVIGNDRMFLSALIIPNFEALEPLARQLNVPYRLPGDLVMSSIIQEYYWKEIQKLQEHSANYERVRKFILLDKPFSIEDGDLTPTLKVRRKIVEEKYKELIDGIYQDVR